MTTVQNIIDRSLRPMRDTALEFFSNAELIEYLNDASVDLCSREKIFEREDTTFNSVSGVFTVPADVFQIRWLVNPDGIEVNWYNESVWKAYVVAFPSWSDDDPIAAAWGDQIHVWPLPADADNWTLGYYGAPTAYTTVGDTISTPLVWDARLVRYVRGECYYRLGETDMGDREMQRFAAGLRPAEGVTNRNLPGRATLTRELSIFDLDPDNVHLGG